MGENIQLIPVKILNWLNDKLKDKKKTVLSILAWFVLLFFLSFRGKILRKYIFSIKMDKTIIGLIVLLALVAIAILSMKKPVKPIKVRWPLLCGWMLFGVILVIWEIIYNLGTGYIPMEMAILIGFPIVGLIWINENDFEELFAEISWGMEFSVFAYSLINFTIYPLGYENAMFVGRYCGLSSNPNHMGMIATSAVVCSLYLISRNKGQKIFHFIILSLSCGLIYLSASRTAMLAVLCAFIIFVMFFIKYYENEPTKNKWKTIIAVLVAILLAVALSRTIFSLDPLNRIEKEVQATTIEERIETNVEDQSDANDISSGRVFVWQTYLSEINMFGHDCSERAADFTDIGYAGGYAHNNYLEFAYAAGLPAGILYFVLVITSCVMVAVAFFDKNKFKPALMFTALAVAAYFVYSMLEAPISPVEREIILLYYIGIVPFFGKEEKRC